MALPADLSVYFNAVAKGVTQVLTLHGACRVTCHGTLINSMISQANKRMQF